MNFKYWKLMFLLMLYSSIMISISSNSWFSIWLGLEINMMSIIPLMNNSKNMMNTESSIKYFITQTIASTILLMTIILMSNNLITNNFSMIMMMNSSILMKLGSAPFHFWFPEVMEGQKWSICLIILTFQKIIPFLIMNYSNIQYFSIIIILNMLISMMLGMNQTSIRKIMTFSSINHIAWMISIIIFSKTIWIMYFIIYMITMMILTYIFNNNNIYSFNQLIKMNLSINFKLMLMMLFISMAGLPPFIGFMPKWLTIQILMENNMYMISTIMIILTLFTMFYYMRLMFTTLMFSSFKISKNNKLINMNMFMLINLPMFMILFI